MMDLEKEIRGLEKPEPSAKFYRDAKARLMHKINLYEKETWFVRLLRKVGPVMPSEHFIQRARVRLMSRISAVKQPIFGWLAITKRVVASTLVMTIAVMATLFFAGGKQPVSAAENTYLEVLEGEVKIKHTDKLIWDVITKRTELSAGDLLQLSESANAVIHFFDDSEVRLAGGSLFLLNRLNVSPGFAKQGVIETTLHEGQAWVQTLNVDDGFARFSLITPDAIVSTNNASFDVVTGASEPTDVRVFKYGVNVKALKKDSRNVLVEGKLSSLQQISLDSAKSYKYVSQLANLAPITDLTEADRDEAWVMDNFKQDKEHLVKLRDREFINLRAATGALPGQMLYPIKRARERLSAALRFNDENTAKAQVDMANQRLSESIVLIEQGETEKAKLALAEYQNLANQIASETNSDVDDREQLSEVIVAHQKTLIAALPSDSQISIVKQALDETEELLADNPIEKAEIRLQNALEDLVHIQDYVSAGELEAAKEALEEHEILASSLLEEVTEFEDVEEEKSFLSNILEAQYEERRILGEIKRELARKNADESIVSLVKSADKELDNGIKLAASAVRPYLPDVALSKVVMLPLDEKVYEFTEKVKIYNTYQGQKNQINRLFDNHPQYARDMEFLTKLRNKLDFRAKDLVNARILQLQGELKAAKDKRVRVKIQRSKDLRD